MGISDIEFKRSVSSNSIAKQLVNFNAETGYIVESGINSSIRGKTSGFDMNLARLPGVFSFNDEKAGLHVGKKYFTRMSNNDYVQISEQQALLMEKQEDCKLLIVEQSNGQLGRSDFQCYCMLEQIIYEEVTIHKNKYFECNNDVYVNIGNARTFANKALGYDNDSAYDTVNTFIKRIRGLSFTAKGTGIGFSLKTGEKRIYCELDYKPFTGVVIDGGIKGNKGINILVNFKYIQNIINGGTKLQYNDILNSIQNPLSKFLFRYLTLMDSKFHIYVKYTTLVQVMDIKRETTLSAACRQIGRIASRINNSKAGNVLLYSNISNKGRLNEKMPFGVNPIEGDWQFVFSFDVNTTPDMHFYSKTTKKLVWEVEKYNRWKEIIMEIHEHAAELGMTPEEYFKHGYGGIFIFKNQSLSENEMERVRKYFANKAKKRSIVGKKAERIFQGVESASKALDEIEAKMKEERNSVASSEDAAVIYQAPKRGRGRPKKCDDIPF